MVVEGWVYSIRLQPASSEAVKTGTVSFWKLEKFYCPDEDCTRSNGNVLSRTLDVNHGAPLLTTTYGYDGVNRITPAAECDTQQPTCVAGTPGCQL